MSETENIPDTAWPQEDPDLTLRVLNSLKNDALPNNRPFYKSYTKWASLTRDQKNKATAYFNSLRTPVKIAVRTQVENLANAEVAASRQQSMITSANDRARFMHAMVDPLNQVALTDAMTPLDRPALDAVENRRAPWDIFADNFNDYELCQYQNATIQHENGLPVNPYAALPGLETMADYTYTINPQDDSRPKRDGAWCEKMWKEIRGNATRINENYRKSGNQDAENEFTEWLKFCDNYSDIYKYFRVVVSDGFLDNLGRALPSDQQRDTGGDDDNDVARGRRGGRRRTLSNSPGAVNRRRQRQRRAEMRNDGSPDSDSPPQGVEAISDVIGDELCKQRRQRALQYFASYEGNDEESLIRKNRAISCLEEEAFP